MTGSIFMMSSWLIDTNVLIYSYDKEQSLHLQSYHFIEQAFAGEVRGTIAQQNLLEFLAVVTNPKRVEYPLSLEDALQKITLYVASFPVICPSAKTLFTFAGLVSKYPAMREHIFDLYLAATALDNGINRICTWNVKHFRKLSEVEVRTPGEILKG
ncbi:MAG: type II toxin-antitoxin system VapC family toxin [candidate division KSB1 bacterium]|nr:type II toxin-antitoxin system VapC family toxin [candidate division KSB1 bacterium]MDZ7302923.1 type II toxin-antitoxin system VapC family toxin [candidate division KSB1 bacterium]MDZ7310498.1 type II toxin-antitoxin system VapC family toxin [candidate division KSB1 bacterium]